MISWVVASHIPEILNNNLLATLTIHDGDELILIENASSITMAYAEGQHRAHLPELRRNPVVCYIHSDVRILDLPTLRERLIEDTKGTGIVGVTGSRTMVLPWWNGDLLGSVMDSRLGILDFGPGGDCDVVDGLLMATRRIVPWDIAWPGWHGYDYDACTALLRRGMRNWCVSNGHLLVQHNSDSPLSLHYIHEWPEAEKRYREKWLTP